MTDNKLISKSEITASANTKLPAFSRKSLCIPYGLFLALFVVFPLFLIIYYAFTSKTGAFSIQNFIDFFSNPTSLSTLFISLLIGALTTLLCLLIGYPVAYILTKIKAKKSAILLLLFIMPMWINFVLRTAAMKELLYSIGMFNSNKTSFINTLIGMVYDYLPFAILPIYTILQKLDKNIIEASSDLGASNAQTLFKVTIPLSMPGIVSAVTMILLPTMTSYVVSDTLGNGNVTIIGKLIENQFSTMFNWNAGSAIAMILLVFIFATMIITGKFTDNDSADARGGGLW
jgi:spermidine/putrescine transport system permease protein